MRCDQSIKCFTQISDCMFPVFDTIKKERQSSTIHVQQHTDGVSGVKVVSVDTESIGSGLGDGAKRGTMVDVAIAHPTTETTTLSSTWRDKGATWRIGNDGGLLRRRSVSEGRVVSEGRLGVEKEGKVRG